MAEVKFEPIDFEGLTIRNNDKWVILTQEHRGDGETISIYIPMLLAYQVGFAIAHCPDELEMKCEKKSRKDE